MDASAQAAFSVRSAQAIARRSSRFTYLLSLLMPASDRPFFWTWYAYVRWVDDIADDMKLSLATRYDFLTRQIQLVQDLYSEKRVNLSKDEAALSALVAYDTQRGKLLEDPLSAMLGAMQFDVQRHGTLSEHGELRRNFDHEVANCLFAIGYFCRIPDIPTKVPGRAAANGAKIAHVLRDFLHDCDEGTFNISRQELDAYGLALPTLKADLAGPAGRRWVASNVRLAERQLMSGLREASETPGIRYPIIVAILVAKYQAYLDRFRANDYVLKPQTRLGYSFVTNLVANLGALLLRSPRSIRRSIASRLPDRLVACSTPELALLVLRLFPIFNRPVVTALSQALKDVNIPIGNLPKLRRRFVTAYWIGRTSYASVDTSKDERYADRIHCAGLVYAFWSLAAIELDRLIDDRALPPEVAQTLVSEWLDKAAEAFCSGSSTGQRACLQTPAPASSDGQNSSFRQLTNAFQTYLSHYRRLATATGSRDSIADTFLVEARAVLMAQINSREQKILAPRHNWNWYLTQVLNQKTLGFAFAPWALWVRDGTSRERCRKLEDASLTLNAGYWHWQILDDLADVRVDTRQGRVTTPGFILLSQGALARSYLDTANETQVGRSAISSRVDTILNSQLVCERFLASPLADDFRHLIDLSRPTDTPGTCESMLRCALTNNEDEFFLDLTQISLARRDQAASYLAAMTSGDWNAALDALAQSRVAGRVLSSVDEDIARIEVREQMALISDRASRTVLMIVELLIRHCYRKARRANIEV
jgi:phytoene/squalene synthetase